MSYLELERGITVESRRSLRDITTMVDFAAMSVGSTVRTLPLSSLKREAFNATLRSVLGLLTPAAKAESVDSLLPYAFAAAFADPFLERFATGASGGLGNRSLIPLPKGKVQSASDAKAWAERAWVHARGGLGPLIREASSRSGLGNHTLPSLFRAHPSRAELTPGAAVVTCSSPALIDATLRSLRRLRAVGSSLPVEIWHVGELSAATRARAQPALDSLGQVRVRDLTPLLSPALAAHPEELGALRSWMCKPLALMASVYEEVCTSAAPPLHLPLCTSPAPSLHLPCTSPCTSPAPPLHLPCTSPAPPLHLPCTSPCRFC